jgi:hypothetical protein
MTRGFAFLLPRLAIATPALAGSKATYEGLDGPPLLIEVADNGDARIGATGKADAYGLLIGEEFYLVSHEDGSWKVARIADQAAAFDRVLPPIFRTIFGAAGGRTVAGVPGEVYTMTGLDPEKPAETSEMVVTQDPRLAPAGRALAGFNDAMMVMMRPLIGEMAASEIAQNHATAALGTPLDVKGGVHLTAFAVAAVDPARLALPAKPQTVDQIVAGIKIRPTTGQ